MKHWTNPLYPILADKAAAKEYVATVDRNLIVPTLYVGTGIRYEDIVSMVADCGSIVLKSTHGSGAVYFLDSSSDTAEVARVLQALRSALRSDHGVRTGETWYSYITPQIIVEPNLSVNGTNVPDYKFHVFKGEANNQPEIIIQVDYDRHTRHERSFFDVDGNALDFRVKVPQRHGASISSVRLARLLPIARALAEPFSYVRIDLYDTDTGPRFGEYTFAHGSGYERFFPRSWDFQFGAIWQGDPA